MLGEEESDTLTSMVNLASTYQLISSSPIPFHTQHKIEA